MAAVATAAFVLRMATASADARPGISRRHPLPRRVPTEDAPSGWSVSRHRCRLHATETHGNSSCGISSGSASDAPGSSRRRSAAVLGAGVVGLSVALRLLEEGFDVTVTSDEDDERIVSHGAGGFWFPYLVEPMDRASGWALETYHELVGMMAEEERGARDDPERASIVRMRRVFLYDDLRERPPRPRWAPPDLRDLTRDELPDIPPAYGVAARGGWTFEAPVVEMPRYLAHLRRRAESLGATFRRRRLVELADAEPANADVVVNCAGLGNAAETKRLARDGACYPIRGQIVRARAPKVEAVYLAELGAGFSCYAIPRGDLVVFGGTHEEGEWDETPDEATASRIVERVAAMLPAGLMEDVEVMGHWSGLRPGRRGGCRLELGAETDGRERPVVHCYGHGGAGVTCSWGCANEVVALVKHAVCSS